MSDRPEAVAWRPSEGATVIILGVATIVIASCHRAWGWVPILDSANLAFHEAGHPIFGLFGATLGLYGGTLGQLVFPLTVIVTFWRRKEFLGAALGGLWLLENGLNIARYMADARAQVLPLVGGGEHDWFNILTRWHALNSDTSIARALAFLCWAGMIGLCFAAFFRWSARASR